MPDYRKLPHKTIILQLQLQSTNNFNSIIYINNNKKVKQNDPIHYIISNIHTHTLN